MSGVIFLVGLLLLTTASGLVTIHGDMNSCDDLAVEGSQHQFQKEGVFRKIEETCGGKAAYQQSWPFQENYLFFLSTSGTGGWLIGPRLCEDNGGVFLNDTSVTRPYGSHAWREHFSNVWNDSPRFRVTCLDRSPVCDVITMEGSTVQPRKEGIFARIQNESVVCGGRPIWKQVWLNAEHYLFFYPGRGSRWLVGPQPCSAHAGIQISDGALSPDRVQGIWTEFARTKTNPAGEWRNSSIRTTCSGIPICRNITIMGTNHQQDKEGFYVMMDVTQQQCSDKPIWRQVTPTATNYLFYLWQHRIWVVGPRPCDTFGGLMVVQSSLGPDTVAEPWREFNLAAGTWVINPSIHLSCVGSVEENWLASTTTAVATPTTTVTTLTTSSSTTTTVPTTLTSTTSTSAPVEQNSDEEEDVPELVFTTVPEDASVPIGDIIMLECAVNDPDAEIYWYFNDDPISSENGAPAGMEVVEGLVLVTSVQMAHAGVYICVAENDEHTIETEARVRLDTSACGVEFTQTPTTGSVRQGRSHVFRCMATNAERIEWRKREHGGTERRLRTTSRIQISSRGILVIRRACFSDEGEYVCIAYKQGNSCEQHKTATLAVWHMCGQPTVAQPAERPVEESAGYIVGGSDAVYGATPWMAMLVENRAGTFCGGALIDRRWVLTAAHCIKEFNDRFERPLLAANMVVKLGKWDSGTRETHERELTVTQIITHPSFDEDSYDSDIALLKLESDVTYSDYIQPICLSRLNLQQEYGFLTGGRMGTLTGWGSLVENGPRPVHLQEIQLPLQSTAVCEASTDFPVSGGMLCAGYAQAVQGDACEGDSGAPYVMKHQDRWHIVGLVSWGEGCAQPGKYGFYTRVAHYHTWISTYLQTTCV